MVDVFISYSRKERELMLPLKRRLEALGLTLFVDVDGRLDGSPTFSEALDKGVRMAKAVLGCWSPWALTREWVLAECAIAKDDNKLVAVERLALSQSDVPLLFYLVERKPLMDFFEDQPHEGWAITLSALAAKLELWADKQHDELETAETYAKVKVLKEAAQAERAALGIPAAFSFSYSAQAMGERFSARQDQTARELSERLVESEERSALRLQEAISQLSARLSDIDPRTTEAVTPVQKAMATFAARLIWLEERHKDDGST